MRSSFARTMTRTAAHAASPSPECSSTPRSDAGSTYMRASWSATAGAMLRPASARAAGRFSLIAATMSARSNQTPLCSIWAKPQFGSSRPMKEFHPVTDASDLRIKIFADGADRVSIARLHANPLIKGFTTNPTLMRKAGVEDYETFAREILEIVSDRPISFEVFSDDFGEMEEQALQISSWAENVYVKLPVTNTGGEPTANVVGRLADRGVKVNVTALTTPGQVKEVVQWVAGGPSSYVSVF